MPSMPIRGRSWVFTINNFTSDDLERLARIECQYIIYGIERGASGTPHLQGFVHFENARTRQSVANKLPRAFLDKRRGTVQQAIDYCKKDNLFTERGTQPLDQDEVLNRGRTKANANHREIIRNAEQGNFDWIKEHYPAVWIARHAQLRSMYKPTPTILDGELHHEWWVGDTGCGKSRQVWRLYPNHYQKQLNKWWDGYDGEHVVVIEEWCPKNEVSGSQLKIWADRYPFPGQIKGGTLQRTRPKKIIVLSNYSIQECFHDAQDRDPILRRFTQIRFPEEIALTESRARLFHEELGSAIGSPDELRRQNSDSGTSASNAQQDTREITDELNGHFTEALADRDIVNFLTGLVD